MKRIFIALTSVAMLSFTACNNATDQIKDDSNTAETNTALDAGTVEAEGTPTFTFAEETYDFGDITDGDVVEHDFTFKNTGNAPLIITNAEGSCGCTVPQWPREPIAPGEEGLIKVSFNSTGKTGNQTKEVKLYANTVPNIKMLRISAQVQPKAGTETEAPAQDANS